MTSPACCSLGLAIALRHGIFQRQEATTTDPAALRLFFPLSYDRTLDDYTASLAIRNTILDASPLVSGAKVLRVKARGEGDGQHIHIALVESNGTSWSQQLTLSTQWQEHLVPLTDLKPARAVKLPLGFPGRWNYWLTAPKRRGGPGDRPLLSAVEHLQISFRPDRNTPSRQTDAWADINSITLRRRSSGRGLTQFRVEGRAGHGQAYGAHRNPSPALKLWVAKTPSRRDLIHSPKW